MASRIKAWHAAYREAHVGAPYFGVKIIFRDWKGYQSRKIKKLLFQLVSSWCLVGVCLVGFQPAPALPAGGQGRRRYVPLAAYRQLGAAHSRETLGPVKF